MSITFAGLALFDSGPARVLAEGLALRHADQPALDGRGARLFSQGREPRTLTQTGTLTADSQGELQAQLDAIETQLDGLPHELIDQDAHAFASTVMLRFEPAAMERLGVRWKTDYRITYRQLVV